ncbi:MAG: MarR family winged helix-turn-helix transcriptional regulator [Streptococcus sp.]|nr:MarR family winged helix-turn-helix transcriptional regulator [Streptococcus sp.]
MKTIIIGEKIAHIYEEMIFHRSKELEKLGVDINHYNYILTISDYPGCNQNFLAQKRKVDKAMVTRIVNKYINQKLIEKKVHPQNKSAYSLYLTTEGEKIAKRIKKTIIEINNKIIKHYSTDSLNSLIEQLDNLSAIVEEELK